MSSTGNYRSKMTVINCGPPVYSAFFTPDGKHVLSGGKGGKIQRWQVDDGHEVGTAIQTTWNAISAVAQSMDRKWLVCGLQSHPYVKVWDADTCTNVLDFYGHTSTVQSVDISPNSTTFATGASGSDACAFIWSISTGKTLVGPLKHASAVIAVRFSPDGARLATASIGGSIQIFDSNDGQRLIDIPCPFNINQYGSKFEKYQSNRNQYEYNYNQYGSNYNRDQSHLDEYRFSPLAWSVDGHQIFAVSAPMNGAKCFNTSSGFVVSSWPVHGGSLAHPCIAPSSNQKFIAVTGDRSLSFWDASTHHQIGPVIEHSSPVFFMVLSPNDDYVVTGEHHGKVTIRSLRDILPDWYFTRQLPLMQTSDAAFEAWSQGDLSRVEQVLTREMLHPLNPSRHAQVLAQRSLVRSRLKQYSLAISDATQSVGVRQSTLGQIAITIARTGNGEYDAAMRVFDLAFTNDHSIDINLILLIKAIVLFECGSHNEAILRVDDLISIVDDKTMYVTVRAQMHLLLAAMSLKKGDHEQAAELLGRAGEAIIPEECGELVVISLMFGWNFDGLALIIEQHLQQCVKALEDIGDVAMESEKAEEAISSYTAALSSNPSNRVSLLVKRSRAWAMQMSWEDALKDADEAIKSDPQDPWGYERKHAALHALQLDDEAVVTLSHMVSLAEDPLAISGAQCKCHGGGAAAALAHVLEDIVACLGEAAVLGWTGQSSSYNSCLPGPLAIHNPASHSPPVIDDVEMDVRVEELKSSMSHTDAVVIYDRVIRSPSTRFSHRRLLLPCILFPVMKLVEKDDEIGEEKRYRARASGLGHIEFRTSDKVSLSEPRRLAFAHPWIRDLRGSAEEVCGSLSDNDDDCLSWSDSDAEEESLSRAAPSEAVVDVAAPVYVGPIATMDISTRALRLVVRLQQPFRALLLQQQEHASGGYKRVAAEHEIVAPGLERRISSAKDVRVDIVEIL